MVTKPFRVYLIGMIFIACMWAFLLNVQPYLIKLILNAAQDTQKCDLFYTIAFFMSLYLLSELVYVSIFRVYDWIIIRFRPVIKKHIGLILMEKMMQHAHSFYQHQFAGSLTTRINDIVIGVPDIVRIIIDRLFACLLMMILALYNMSLVQIKFAVALAVWISSFLILSLYMVFRNQHLAYEVAGARAIVTGHIVDVLTNMPTIRFFAGRRFEHNYLAHDMQVSVEKDQNRDWFFLKLHALQGISFLFLQVVCFWWLLHGLINNMVTPGDFVLILTLNLHIIENFWNIAKDMRDFWEKIGNIVQALAIIQSPVEIKDAPQAKDLVVTEGKIVFENVQFQYKGAESLFEHKSVIIAPGQKVGLVGYSGSGKSTFINLILRVFDVTSGAIMIDDQNIQTVTQESLHRSIAVIPQEPSLFHRSIMENILYGKLNATSEDVIMASQRAHAHDFIMNLPEQYNTPVGERGVKLSGGQRQRIVIARALLKNAPILILDEATSQLDSVVETEIQESLDDLMRDKTTLVIAHRLSTLQNMDRILVFDKGSIVEDGSHEELLVKNGLYKKLWEAQIGGFLLV